VTAAGVTLVRVRPGGSGVTMAMRSPTAGGAPFSTAGSGAGTDDHVVANLSVAEAGWLVIADVIVDTDERCAPPVFMSRVFSRYPGCAVAVTTGHDGVVLAGCRDGRTIGLTPIPQGRVRSYAEIVTSASLAHLRLACGRWPIASNGMTLVSVSASGGAFRSAWAETSPGTGEHGPVRPAPLRRR